MYRLKVGNNFFVSGRRRAVSLQTGQPHNRPHRHVQHFCAATHTWRKGFECKYCQERRRHA